MKTTRRTVLLASLCLVATTASTAWAQTPSWPHKPITLVVPYPAGGVTDVQARALGASIGPTLGQPVVIENRAGAGGSIGSSYVAQQAPDGYTLVIGTQSTHAANKALYKDLRYDPLKSFTPIHGFIEISPLLGVHPSRPYQTLEEFIAYAKANPGSIRYGSAGIGSGGHLIGEIFQSVTGVQLTHIPYKGTSQVVTDLIGGHIDAAFDPPMTLLQPMLANQIRPLAFMGNERLKALPNVPTVAEAGVPGAQIPTWTAIYAPAGTPTPVVRQLADAIGKAMQTKALQDMVASYGGVLMQDVQEARLEEFSRAQFDKWHGIAVASGAQLD